MTEASSSTGKQGAIDASQLGTGRHRLGWGPRGTAAATIAAELRFENVSRHFGANDAVIDFSLTVAAGQILCLLGPSGCGKTTLLRVASGIEKPSSGRVLINSKEVSGPNVFVPPEKRGVGLMFQDFALFPHLTVLENVFFGLKGLRDAEKVRVSEAALERVGLGDYGEKYPHMLSGGEQQRVALARAVVPRPSVLLMDEPFSGLDTRLRDLMRKETLAVLRETRATCVLVTHQPEEAMQIADVIAVMRDGQLVQAGPAQELYHQPCNSFVARMFSDLNEFPVVVRGGEIDMALGRFPAAGFMDGSEVTLAVRQRGVRILPSGQGIYARVLEAKFLGDAAHLELAVEGMEGPLYARIGAQHCPERGADVGVEIDPEMVMVLNGDKD